MAWRKRSLVPAHLSTDFPTDVDKEFDKGLQEAVIVEVTSAECRIGYSGNTSPAVVLKHGQKPYVYSDESGLCFDVDDMEICMKAGLEAILPKDLSACEKNPEHLLLVTPNQAVPKMNKQLSELLFERLDLQNAYCIKGAPLNAYAHGLVTALVLDVGASHSSSAIVRSGQIVSDRTFHTAVGGDFLDALLFEKMMDGISGGAHVDLSLDRVRDLRTNHCVLPPAVVLPGSAFLLPDGTQISLDGREDHLTSVPDYLFAPASLVLPQDRRLHRTHEYARRMRFRNDDLRTQAFHGLQWLLASCFAKPDELKAEGFALLGAAEKLFSISDLGAGIVLAGRCTRMPGFQRRCHKELLATEVGQRLLKETKSRQLVFFGGDRDVRHMRQKPTDVKWPMLEYDTFLGGAIVANCGVPHWVTKAEYVDRGVTALDFYCC